MTDISKLSTIPSVTPEMQIPVWDNKNRQPRRASLQQVTDMATAGAAASAAEAAASAAETAAAVPSVHVADYPALRAYSGAAQSALITGSGIAGTFVRDATVTVDNGGTEIVGVHGWRRVFDGRANALWFGVAGDGSNDTAALSAAITAAVGYGLFIPKPSSKYAIDPITVPSNSDILIEPGTIIEGRIGYVQTPVGSAQRMVTLSGASNVRIEAYGVTFRYAAGYVFTSEFNHVFRIIGAGGNIWIYGAAANSSGGDGFFIGPSNDADEANTSPDGVYLVDCSADANRRNGFSIVAGRARLIRPRATNQPAAILGYGIDVEPNLASTFIDVVIEDPYTYNNAGAGVGTVINNPDGSTASVHVEIRGHNSDQDRWGYVHYGSKNATSYKGAIHYLNPVVKKSDEAGIRVLNCSVNGPRIVIGSPTVIDCNQNTGGTAQSASGIAVLADVNMSEAAKIGNVHILNPDVFSSDGKMQAPIWIEDTRGAPQGVDKTYVLDPVRLSGGVNAFCGSGGFVVWRDSLPVLSHDLAGAGLTLTTLKRYYGLFHNATSAAERTVDLPNRADYPDMAFEVRAAQYLRIDPDAASAIYPLSTVAGKYVRSNTPGSRLVISRRNATTWYVKEQIGTWEVEP
jgi:hypothetical protein